MTERNKVASILDMTTFQFVHICMADQTKFSFRLQLLGDSHGQNIRTLLRKIYVDNSFNRTMPSDDDD